MSGRKSKLTPEVKDEFVRLISQGVYIRQACEFIGIAEATVYNWMARGSNELLRLENNPKARLTKQESIYVEFFRAVKKADTQAEVRAITYWQAAIKDDWRAAREFLARRYPDRWSPRIELTGADGKPIEVHNNVDVVTLEQKVLAVLEARNARSISGGVTEGDSD